MIQATTQKSPRAPRALSSLYQAYRDSVLLMDDTRGTAASFARDWSDVREKNPSRGALALLEAMRDFTEGDEDFQAADRKAAIDAAIAESKTWNANEVA